MPLQTAWKRIIRFIAAEDGATYFGEPTDASLDVGEAVASGKKVQAYVLDSAHHASAQSLLSAAPNPQKIRTVGRLLTPLSREQVGTIRALGANYVQPGQNAQEARGKRPKIPILFYKPLSALANPGDEIVVPLAAKRDGDETDYEAELVIVIGKDCKDVRKEEALDYVLGYTLSNDVSARKRMFATPQWGLGKSFNTFLPIGPVLVAASGIPNPDDVGLATLLDGKKMQEGNTRDQLWLAAETIAELSQGTTLEAGSIISM